MLNAFPDIEANAVALKQEPTGPATIELLKLRPTAVDADGGTRLGRAMSYAAKLSPSIQGQNGSRVCFNAALKLMSVFDLSEEEALGVLKSEFNPRCKPPWNDEELRHKIKDAAKQSRERRGEANARSGVQATMSTTTQVTAPPTTPPMTQATMQTATQETAPPTSYPASETQGKDWAHLFEPLDVVVTFNGRPPVKDRIPFPMKPIKMNLPWYKHQFSLRHDLSKLSDAEFGLFIRLRDMAAENVVITVDRETLVKLSYTSQADFEKSWPRIAHLFVIVDGIMFIPEVVQVLRDNLADHHERKIRAREQWKSKKANPA
jgi:hypothetical protein